MKDPMYHRCKIKRKLAEMRPELLLRAGRCVVGF